MLRRRATGVPAASAQENKPPTPIYLDAHYSPSERAADLVSRLSLDEKAQQMNSNIAPAIPRFGVATWGWWNKSPTVSPRSTNSPDRHRPPLTNATSYPVDLRWAAPGTRT